MEEKGHFQCYVSPDHCYYQIRIANTDLTKKYICGNWKGPISTELWSLFQMQFPTHWQLFWRLFCILPKSSSSLSPEYSSMLRCLTFVPSISILSCLFALRVINMMLRFVWAHHQNCIFYISSRDARPVPAPGKMAGSASPTPKIFKTALPWGASLISGNKLLFWFKTSR